MTRVPRPMAAGSAVVALLLLLLPGSAESLAPDRSAGAGVSPQPLAVVVSPGEPTPIPAPVLPPGSTLEPPSAPDASPSPASTPAPVLVPLVPVTGFWSAERSVSRAGLAAAIAGSGRRPRAVFVATRDLAPLVARLGVAPGPNVTALSPARVRDAVARTPGSLGIVRAGDVTPDVRALAVDGARLFGGERLRDLGSWPLLVPEPAAAAPDPFDAAAIWTLAAGGDVMLDREVHRLAVLRGKGAGYPWAGGTARITARVCCGYPGWEIVRGRRTGGAGAVRELLRGADIALVNLEAPAPDTSRYHPTGYVFTMDPRLLAGVERAGIDVVSLANNHIGNAGAAGVVQTIRNLERHGIAHAGAGRNLADARRPAWLTAGGLRIAVLAYDGVGGLRATRGSAGAAPLRLAVMRTDIAGARRTGADVVVVVPHWGREYTDEVTAAQRRVARALVAAGADVVLGSHSHWAGPLELIDGHLVVHSLGDLVFDLQHDARTQQGLVAELSFVGRRLAQVELHPTLILAASQPHLLEPSGGGNALLREIEAASRRLSR